MNNIIIYAILFLSMLLSFNTKANQNEIRVVLVDTGVDKKKIPVCKTDNKTFHGDDIDDTHGHGTMMAKIIMEQAGDAKLCFVVVKGWNTSFFKAVDYASTIPNIDIVNMSISGFKMEDNLQLMEKNAIELLLTRKIPVVVAAGNEGIDFDKKGCLIFPACHNEKLIVATTINPQTDKGRIVDVIIDNKKWYSSQAAAYVTGNLVKYLWEKRNAK